MFAPHPDDEVLGCGGVLAMLADRRTPVQVIIMTDGRASHPGRIPIDELVALRRAEAEAAASKLGLPGDAYVFLDFPDHRLDAFHDAAMSRISQLLADFRPEQVFVPHRHDGLLDHEATWTIVMTALSAWGRAIDVFEYPVWLWNTWPWTTGQPRPGWDIRAISRTLVGVARIASGCRVHVALDDVLPRKLEALKAYRSQLERRGGDPAWPILSDVSNGDFLNCFMGRREIFRHVRLNGQMP